MNLLDAERRAKRVIDGTQTGEYKKRDIAHDLIRVIEAAERLYEIACRDSDDHPDGPFLSQRFWTAAHEAGLGGVPVEIAGRWERIARRLLVLGDWGMATDLMSGRLGDPDFLSDEWLTNWYGHRFAEDTKVIEALHKADGQCR